MRRVRAAVAAMAVAGGMALVAAPAGAAGPTEPGNACQRTGMATVKSLGVFSAVAKSGVDAGTLKALGVRGIDEVPDSTVFNLPQVLELHRTSPQLFPWCD